MNKTTRIDKCMAYSLITPCKHCPFRTDVTPYLSQASAKRIVKALRDGLTFQCHETVDYSKADEAGVVHGAAEHPNSQHCAGALIMLENNQERNLAAHLAILLGVWNPGRLRTDAPVFKTPEEFINAQEAP